MNYQLIDLTHPLEEKMPSYSGSCGFRHIQKLDFVKEKRVSFRVHKLEMHSGIGTHLDAPRLCFAHGKDSAQIALNSLFCPCFVIDVSAFCHENLVVESKVIADFEEKVGRISENSFVIFYTGWSKYWSDSKKYHNQYRFPSLAKSVAEILLERNINGLGIDTLSPDVPSSDFPIHQLVLGAGKYLVENIAHAEKMPAAGAYIGIFPLPIQEGTEAPARVIGFVQGE